MSRRQRGQGLGKEARTATRQAGTAVAGAIGYLPTLVETARSGAGQLAEQLPEVLDRTRASALGTASTLQTMPDPTLRLLAAFSIGLGAGLYLSGAPRLVTLAALTPALILSFAIVSRPGREQRPR